MSFFFIRNNLKIVYFIIQFDTLILAKVIAISEQNRCKVSILSIFLVFFYIPSRFIKEKYVIIPTLEFHFFDLKKKKIQINERIHLKKRKTVVSIINFQFHSMFEVVFW